MTKSEIDGCAAKGGCEPVKELHKEIIDKPKVPWSVMYILIVGFLSLIGGTGKFLYAEIKDTQKEVKTLTISNAELKVMYKNVQENTTQILDILKKQEQDKNAEKLASKEIKAYNADKN